MAERNPPVWMQSGTYSAAEDRQVTGVLSSRSYDPITGQTMAQVDGGVIGGLDQLRVTGNGTNMAIQVSAGAVIIPAGTNPPGAFLCYNDGNRTITLDAEVSANPRTDLIVADVTDNTADPMAISLWSFKVLKGNPGPNPVPPNPSSSSYQFPIATVKVAPASLNGGVNKVSQTDIVDVRLFNTPQGGVNIKWPNAPYPPVSPGRLVYIVAGKKLQISHGVKGDWVDIYSQTDWKSVLSAMGPRQVSHAKESEKAGPGTDAWDASPNDAGTTNPITTIQLTGVRAPNGKLLLSVSCLGKIKETTSSGHVSVEVRQGGTVVNDANFLHGPSFYSKTWTHGSDTFLASGLPKDNDLTVRVVFARKGNAGGLASFKNVVLVVEPKF
jgi:hypothetical protein